MKVEESLRPAPHKTGLGLIRFLCSAKSHQRQKKKNIIILNTEHLYMIITHVEFEKHIISSRSHVVHMCRLHCFSWVNTTPSEAWIILGIAGQHDSSDLCHFVLEPRRQTPKPKQVTFRHTEHHFTKKTNEGLKVVRGDIYVFLLLLLRHVFTHSSF